MGWNGVKIQGKSVGFEPLEAQADALRFIMAAGVLPGKLGRAGSQQQPSVLRAKMSDSCHKRSHEHCQPVANANPTACF